jgi:hypothetical protein
MGSKRSIAPGPPIAGMAFWCKNCRGSLGLEGYFS